MVKSEAEISKIIDESLEKFGIKSEPPVISQSSKYCDMVLSLQNDPKTIVQFEQLLYEILEPLEETKGMLMISDNGNKVCFAYKGMPYTDFGVIVLAVIPEHYIDHVVFCLKLLVLSHDALPKITKVEARCLGSNKWIEDLGVTYIYEKRGLERIVALIKTMAKYAPVEDEYLFSGWMPDNGNSYILDGHKLHIENWSAENARASCEHTLSMLDVAPHSITIPLLAIVTLSLVHTKMIEKGVYFKGVCCIVAPTQSFKTTIASLFFDFKNGREVDINFEATTAAFVRIMGNSRDKTIIVDDFKPGATKAEAKDMVLKLSKIIRMCSDDSGGIKKAGTHNSITSNSAHCLAVVTAEQIPLKVQSTLARLLVLEMGRKSVDKDKLTSFQENHQKYRAFIKDFITHISGQGVNIYCENLANRFLQERETLRKKLADMDVLVDNRTNDMVTWLHISFSEFLKYALHVKAIDQEQLETYKKEALEVFLAIMEQQAERVSDLDDTKRFFKGLQDLLNTKEVRLETLQARNTSYSAPDSKSAIGFSKRGFIYLKNNVAFQQVASYYRRFGKEFAVSESALRKTLADNGHILPKIEKSFIHRLSVNHETYQCIQFEEAKFNELLRGGKGNGAEIDREIPDNWGQRQNADNILGR